MPYRSVVAKELADLLGAIAHPARIRMIQELRAGERDVNSLSEAVELSQSSASQHLMVLRAHRVVVERREGRHVFYRLRHAEFADWLMDAVELLPEAAQEFDQVRKAIQQVRAVGRIAMKKPSNKSPHNHRSE